MLEPKIVQGYKRIARMEHSHDDHEIVLDHGVDRKTLNKYLSYVPSTAELTMLGQIDDKFFLRFADRGPQ